MLPTNRAALPEFQTLLSSFQRALRAANRRPATLTTYACAVEQFAAFLGRHGLPTRPRDLRREHVEAYLAALLEQGLRPGTAANRFKSLRQFFRWLEEEGEIERSPMARIKPPTVPENPPPILRAAQLEALLKAAEGKRFAERRDLAILRVLVDTGLRLGELLGLRVEDVELDAQRLHVTGKGGRARTCRIGQKATAALDRYLRARAGHRFAIGTPLLWLSQKGALQVSGVRGLLLQRDPLARRQPEVRACRHAHADMRDQAARR